MGDGGWVYFVFLWYLIFFRGWRNCRVIYVRLTLSMGRNDQTFFANFRRSRPISVFFWLKRLVVTKLSLSTYRRFLRFLYLLFIDVRAIRGNKRYFFGIFGSGTFVRDRLMNFRRFIKRLCRDRSFLFAMFLRCKDCLWSLLYSYRTKNSDGWRSGPYNTGSFVRASFLLLFSFFVQEATWQVLPPH